MATDLDLKQRVVGPAVAATIRESRLLAGWSQRELAGRSDVSQSTISRIETAKATTLDIAVIERVLGALGLRAELSVKGRHFDDRRRQADPVHALTNAHVERRLRRLGWHTATEVQIGDPEPRGWIDILAFRPSDRALLVEETKTDIPDYGGMQRTVGFYRRAAWEAARALDWHPRAVHVLVACLDTAAMRARLASNRSGLGMTFPGLVDDALAWLADPTRTPPRGWTIALVDPQSREKRWLRAARLESRIPAPYADYADAVRQLGR